MPSPGIVFHYTTADALPSIIGPNKGCQLRATGIRYLNDQSELDIGIQTVLNLLQCRPGDLGLEGWLVQDLKNTFQENTVERMGHRYFVTCFSSANEIVDQWRGYGDNGIGFALGFVTAELDVALTQYENISVFSCVYEKDVQEDILIRAVHGARERFRKFEDSPLPGYNRDQLPIVYKSWVVDALQKNLLRIKHNAYHQEREWRVVIDPFQIALKIDKRLVLDIEFRPTKRGLVPFVTLPIPTPRLIKVGPSEHQIANYESCKMLLRQRGFSIDLNPDISLSLEDMPFRG